MKKSKKIIGMVACVMSLALAVTLVSVFSNTKTEVESASESAEHKWVGGVSAALTATQTMMFDRDLSVEKSAEEMLAAARGLNLATDEMSIESTEETEEILDESIDDNDEKSEEEAIEPSVVAHDVDYNQAGKTIEEKWKNRVMAKVSDYLTIRKSASSYSQALARMYPRSVVTLVEYGDSWCKVKGAGITGYVYTQYCLFGMDAYNNFKKVCPQYASVKDGVENLNVRKKANTSSKIVGTLDKDEFYEVCPVKGLSKKWVAIKYNKKQRYVSAEYVDLTREFGEAVLLEDDEEVNKNTSHDPMSATKYEKKLLAGIMHCEAQGLSHDNLAAVGAVVLNRVRSSRYPDNIKDVLYQSGQFTPAGSGSLARAIENGKCDMYMDIVDEVLAGYDPTNGAIGFALASSGRDGVVIGPVVFF